MMKYVAPLLLVISGWNYGTDRILAQDTSPAGPFKPTITAYKDGAVEDRLTYRREFDTLKECQEFVVSNDEAFVEKTKEVLKMLVDRGDDMATLSCEPVTKKNSI